MIGVTLIDLYAYYKTAFAVCLYMDWLKNSALFVRLSTKCFYAINSRESFEACFKTLSSWLMKDMEVRSFDRFSLQNFTFLQPLSKTLYFAEKRSQAVHL